MLKIRQVLERVRRELEDWLRTPPNSDHTHISRLEDLERAISRLTQQHELMQVTLVQHQDLLGQLKALADEIQRQRALLTKTGQSKPTLRWTKPARLQLTPALAEPKSARPEFDAHDFWRSPYLR